MSLDEVLARRKKPVVSSSVPNTNYVDAAIKKIFDRWPDVNPEEREEDHEKILEILCSHIRNEEWENVKMSFVIFGFQIAFLPKFKNRSDANEIIEFAFNELEATSKPSLVNALLKVYSSTFSLNSQHTEKLGQILAEKQDLFGQNGKTKLKYFPDFLVPDQAVESIADFMFHAPNTWLSLKQSGINNPFESGIMDYAHEGYVNKLSPHLNEMSSIEEIFEWCAGREQWRAG